MVISRLHRPLSLTLATLGLISLVACGGGGSSNKPPVVVDDTTPNAFSFTAAEGAEPNAVITSPTATISGINTATPISISGGEYSIAGGAFTSTAGTITNGQSLVVRLTASDKTNTAKAVTVTIGGVSATFNVTTLVDITADAFSFTAVTGAELNKEYTSEAITVGGIDVAIPVSVSGGLYSINGGEFTSAAGTVSAGQTITLKATSGNNTDTTQNAVLSVGSISGTFAVTTIPDTTPPVAEFKFPTPYTMSEANSVKVRGVATDDHAIKSVKVIVRSYKFETPETTIETKEIAAVPKSDVDGVKDYSSWTAEIPLTALAENEIKVVATDYRDNEIEIVNANKVVIRQADVKSAFPDDDNEADIFTGSIALDYQNGRNRLLVSGRNPTNVDEIYAIDMFTGKRSVAISVEQDGCGRAEGSIIDPNTQHLFVFCNNNPGVLLEYNLTNGQLLATYDPGVDAVYGMASDFNGGRNQIVLLAYLSEDQAINSEDAVVLGFNLDKKTFSIISKAGQQPFIIEAQHLAVDGDRYLITAGGFDQNASKHSVISINASNGVSNILSNNNVGTGELFSSESPEKYMAALMGATIDLKRKHLLVNEVATSKLFSVDLITGDRNLYKNLSYQQPTGDTSVANQDIVIDEYRDVAIIDDGQRTSILLIDLETREKIILSKSKNNF